MPIVSNPVIDTFLQAIGAQNDRARLAQEKDLREKELQQQADQLAELKDYHTKENNRLEALQNFQMASQRVAQQAELQNQFEKTGNAPAGYAEDENQTKSYPITDGVTGTQRTFNPIDQNLPSFTALDPTSAALRDANRESIVNAPKTAAALELENAKTKAAMELKKSEEAALDERARQDRITRTNINAATNASRLEVAKLKGKSDKTTSQIGNITEQYNKNEAVKRFQLVNESAKFANSIDPNNSTGSDDIGLLKAYAKAVDPSAISRGAKETELLKDMVQTVKDKWGVSLDRLYSGSGQLSTKAKQDIIKTINDKLKTQTEEFNTIKEGYGKRLKAVGEDPNYWLDDFSGTNNSNKPDLSQFDPNVKGKK